MATLLTWAATSGGMTALPDVFRSSSQCQGGGRIYPQARPGALEPFRPCGGGRMRRLGCDSGQGGLLLAGILARRASVSWRPWMRHLAQRNGWHGGPGRGALRAPGPALPPLLLRKHLISRFFPVGPSRIVLT